MLFFKLDVVMMRGLQCNDLTCMYQRAGLTVSSNNYLQCNCCCCSISEGCKEAVAALARYVLLKCPDKADFRSRAVECAVKLTTGLPQRARNDFVIFAAHLSRTAKASVSCCSSWHHCCKLKP